MKTLSQFVADLNGKGNIGNTPENKGQCVGLAFAWILNLGQSHFYGHAKDLYTNAPSSEYTKIKNAPNIYPISGDIMVWDSTVGGGFGHTAPVIGSSKADDSFTVIEQNNPLGSPCRVHTYKSWNGVIGWLRPKNLAEPIVDCVEVQKQLTYERGEKEKYKTRSRELAEALEKETKAKESAIEVNLNLIKRQTEMEKIYVEDAKRAKEQRETDLKTIKNREAVIVDLELREDVLLDQIKELEDSEKLTLSEFPWIERLQSLFIYR